MKHGKIVESKAGAVNDVDPQDVIDVIKKTIKIIGDLLK